MKKLALCAAGAFVLSGIGAAPAHDHGAQDITIIQAWTRPAAEGQNGAVYFTVRNGGEGSDIFVSAESPVAQKAELHETRDENGVMTMRAVNDLEIKPGSSLELKPGGYHLMLLRLKKPLEAGSTVPLTIRFEKGGAVSVDVKVDKSVSGSTESMPMHGHGTKDMAHPGH